jgi:hypothetical protein
MPLAPAQTSAKELSKMTRNLKALGLALVAAFAMSAIAASAAQAEGAPTLTPASYPAWLTTSALGEQVYTFSNGNQWRCTNVGGHATIEKAGVGDTEVTLTDVSYTGCWAIVGKSTLPATVDMTGCDYKFSGGETEGTDHFVNGAVAIECPTGVTGPDVTIFETAAKHTEGKALCHITVWNTVTAGSVTYTNTAGTPNDVDIKSVGVTNPVTRSGSLLCGSPTSATYDGEVTVKAYEDEGLEPDGTTPKEGAQVGLTVSHTP